MNLLDILRADHRVFLGLLNRLDRSVMGQANHLDTVDEAAGESAKLIADLMARMEKHEEVEDRLLWPLIRSHVPDAEPALQVIEADHAGLNRVMGVFKQELATAGRSPAWLILGLARLANMVRSHIAREEADLFTVAARRVPAVELERLGRDIKAAKGAL